MNIILYGSIHYLLSLSPSLTIGTVSNDCIRYTWPSTTAMTLRFFPEGRTDQQEGQVFIAKRELKYKLIKCMSHKVVLLALLLECRPYLCQSQLLHRNDNQKSLQQIQRILRLNGKT